ncbi:MAG: hypothetical protein JNL48_19925 [Acidobacteria bacterium]|nr:hypothetical protein [Acidobacteriota bacterium]
MSEPVIPPLPDPASPPRLVRATLTAAALAGVLLVTVVLPAEYGIDPTRIGRATGLYRAPETAAEPLPESTGDGASAAAGGGTGSLFKSATPYRSDEMSLTLAPGEGAEIKAQMNAGERLVFSWTSTGGGVDVDMHGEAADKTGGDRSYWTGEFESGGHGAFEAPMTGNHGWFWQNLNDAPVTITVKTSGFYSRLFQP